MSHNKSRKNYLGPVGFTSIWYDTYAVTDEGWMLTHQEQGSSEGR